MSVMRAPDLRHQGPPHGTVENDVELLGYLVQPNPQETCEETCWRFGHAVVYELFADADANTHNLAAAKVALMVKYQTDPSRERIFALDVLPEMVGYAFETEVRRRMFIKSEMEGRHG